MCNPAVMPALATFGKAVVAVGSKVLTGAKALGVGLGKGLLTVGSKALAGAKVVGSKVLTGAKVVGSKALAAGKTIGSNSVKLANALKYGYQNAGSLPVIATKAAKAGAFIAKTAPVAAKLGTAASLFSVGKKLLTNKTNEGIADTSLLSNTTADASSSIAETISSIKGASGSKIKKTLSSLRIPLATENNDITGINSASSMLGLNLGG